MDIYSRIDEKRGEIYSLAGRYGIRSIRIFGSVARREATEKSDVDFLVEFPPGTSLFDHAAFEEELAGLLKCPVDVASINGIKDRIRDTVLQEAVPL